MATKNYEEASVPYDSSVTAYEGDGDAGIFCVEALSTFIPGIVTSQSFVPGIVAAQTTC